MSILYFNGMNSVVLSRGERQALQALRRTGHQVHHIPVDWQSDESYESILQRGLAAVRAARKECTEVLMVGASAGGTLVVDILARLQDAEGISALSICGRLREGPLAWWDPRTLKRMAFMTARRASRSFYDAVMECQYAAVPGLEASTRQRLHIIRPLLDEVVPRRTMTIDGVKIHTIRVVGHHTAIVTSLRRLPDMLSLTAHGQAHA